MSQIDNLLNFVAGNSENRKVMSSVDDDVFSWLLINSDLFTLNTEPTTGEPSQLHPTDVSPLQSNVRAPAALQPSITAQTSPTPRSPETPVSYETNKTPDVALTDEEKKKLRLERNREIARNCRKRQREKMEQMEEEVKRLREEHEELVFLLRKGVDGDNRENERRRQLKRMREMKDTASEAELKQMMEEYIVSWQDYGQERHRTVKYHLDRLKALLLPTNLTKALTSWSGEKEDSLSTVDSFRDYITDLQDLPSNEEFPHRIVKEQGIWSLICREMEFTPEQQKSILGAKALIQTQRRNLQETLSMLNQLQTKIDDNMKTMKEMVDRYMNILKPSQQIAFLTWIEENQACMFMLNSIWMNRVQPHDN
ncbi:hypothetical protein WA538_002223, partial [Blastocystis sp. DL]